MSQVPKKTIALVKQRDNESCVRCGRMGGNIHHRRMRSQSPKWAVHNIENLILLCGSGTTGCHGWVHGHPAESYENGWMVRSYRDPENVPLIDAEGRAWFLTNRGTKIQAEMEVPC